MCIRKARRGASVLTLAPIRHIVVTMKIRTIGAALLLALAVPAPRAHGQEAAAEAGAEEDAGRFTFSVEKILSISAISLFRNDLRHSDSESVRKWNFMILPAPSFALGAKITHRPSKILRYSAGAGAALTFPGAGLNAALGVTLLDLLELSASETLFSGWNISSFNNMGVYDTARKDYGKSDFARNFSYTTLLGAKLTVPLMLALPKSDWTRLLLQGSAGLELSRFTDAHDGEAWHCGGGAAANGWQVLYGGALVWMLPHKVVRTAVLSVGWKRYLKDSYFERAYLPYDPDFLSCSITPMLSLKFSGKSSGMLLCMVSRERKFADDGYVSNEELLQTRTGARWRLKTVMFTWTHSF